MSDYQKAGEQMRKSINNLNAVVRGIDEDTEKRNAYAAKREKLSVDSDRAIIETAKELQAMRESMKLETSNRDQADKKNKFLTWVTICVASLTLIATIIGILVK